MRGIRASMNACHFSGVWSFGFGMFLGIYHLGMGLLLKLVKHIKKLKSNGLQLRLWDFREKEVFPDVPFYILLSPFYPRGFFDPEGCPHGGECAPGTV
jgi:hypothetical protein